MDFKDYFIERLNQIDSYLSATRPDRKYALGRVLEVETLAFTMRNQGLLTQMEFDRIDKISERTRKYHNLMGSTHDWKSQGGFKTSLEMIRAELKHQHD